MSNLFRCLVLLGVGLIPGQVTAQTFKTLHSFTAFNNGTNSDGAYPYAGLILSGNTLYGTTSQGGSGGSGYGTVFVLRMDGTGFTNLHNFGSFPGDGIYPRAGLILSNSTLYGTANYSYPDFGVIAGFGTVFAVKTDGTSYTNLHSFTALPGCPYCPHTNSDGAIPNAGLILSSNILYGTAPIGGSSGGGTVFAIGTDGTGFTNLHNFDAYTNDEAGPVAGLIISGNTLYGTAIGGGSANRGTVFAIQTTGTGFTNLHIFTALVSGTNSDGANPYAGLVLSGGTLYGTTEYGGSGGDGTVFSVNTDGTGFTTLHNFTAGGFNSLGTFTNSDGANPLAGLILSGNTLYGTASAGGSSGGGTVFAVSTDGTGFTNLHSFTATSHPGYSDGTNSDGVNPQAGLILSGRTLYGTTYQGGSSGNGTVFSLSLPMAHPQLNIIRSASNVILSWPTNHTGFALQFTTNLVSPSVWFTNSPEPVVVNGQYVVTNPISGTRRFYRLSQ